MFSVRTFYTSVAPGQILTQYNERRISLTFLVDAAITLDLANPNPTPSRLALSGQSVLSLTMLNNGPIVWESFIHATGAANCLLTIWEGFEGEVQMASGELLKQRRDALVTTCKRNTIRDLSYGLRLMRERRRWYSDRHQPS